MATDPIAPPSIDDALLYFLGHGAWVIVMVSIYLTIVWAVAVYRNVKRARDLGIAGAERLGHWYRDWRASSGWAGVASRLGAAFLLGIVTLAWLATCVGAGWMGRQVGALIYGLYGVVALVIASRHLRRKETLGKTPWFMAPAAFLTVVSGIGVLTSHRPVTYLPFMIFAVFHTSGFIFAPYTLRGAAILVLPPEARQTPANQV